ncbi:hypothetical protein GGR55DRAFT_373071 [Xylaria sp. FL0064]|nr:hypothetical protein GGR55DRAFT_373071 [Xylaria sp. FL0064]
MEFSNRVIQALPNEIVLRIVEYMDGATRSCFMATSKGVSALMKYHETSICKNCIATFILSPLGDVLSSSTDERHILPRNTFSMLRELELRDRRINHILQDCANRFYFFSPLYFPPLTPIEQARLALILKRAMHQCDRIVDIAAGEPPTPPEYYRCVSEGPYELPSALLSPGDKISMHNPLANPRARPKQIEYIQSLPLEDLMGLYILLLTVECCKLSCPYPFTWSANEWMTIMNECVLRHGSWFLWRFLPGDGYASEWSTNMMAVCHVELEQWELGAISEPAGLKMTLIGRLRDLLGGGNGETFFKRIYLTINKILLNGEEKDKCVKA